MKNHITIDIKSFLFTDVLGDQKINLPYSDELDEAVLLINKIASKEALRREKEDELFRMILNDILRMVDSDNGVEKAVSLLRDLYHRDR